jgi:hypothetical protein
MTRLASRCCGVIVVAVAILAVAVGHGAGAGATAAEPQYPLEVHLFADARQTGVITLSFYGAPGTPVVFYERIQGLLQEIGEATAASGLATVMPTVVTWRCDRLVRRFLAITVADDASHSAAAYDVRTPSCKTRMELDTPRRVARGKVGRIRIVDRWGNGAINVQLCLRPPHGRYACRKVKLAHAVSVVTQRFRPRRSGHWSAELRFRGHTVRRTIAVGSRTGSSKPPLTVLATGDSSMQGIDSYLADALGSAASVRSDVHPGTGLVKPGGPWIDLAALQTKVVRQDVTVMSIGAADDFPVKAYDGSVHQCCDEGWIAEYSGRVKQQMKTYLRGGRARVVWLTLPIPRGARPFATEAINTAVLRAGLGEPGVTVVRTDLVFTPDGHREVMNYRGRDIRLFRPDGVHLTITGTAIAAGLAADAVLARP